MKWEVKSGKGLETKRRTKRRSDSDILSKTVRPVFLWGYSDYSEIWFCQTICNKNNYRLRRSVRSVDMRYIIMLSDEPVKPLRGSPIRSSHYFVFGTSLTSFSCKTEGGNGIGFFDSQEMLVSSLPRCRSSRRWRTNCAAD